MPTKNNYLLPNKCSAGEFLYYIYRHLRNDSGRPFYIGMGKKRLNAPSERILYERAYSTSRHNNLWDNIYKKHGRTVEILLEFKTKEEAFSKEIELIALYGRLKDGGILSNMTDGGEGQVDCVPSEETRKRQREAHFQDPRITLEELTYPEPNTGCELWAGGFYHGRAYINTDNKSHPVTRLKYELQNNIELPRTIVIKTTCGNPYCVNLLHTEVVKSRTIEKSRKGYPYTNHLLDENKVKLIRKLNREEGIGAAEISRRIGGDISRKTIERVINRQNWKWVKDE